MVRSEEVLTVVTPRSRTSCGRRGSAWATRFCTCTWARSTSVPSLKVTVRVRMPSMVDVRGHVEHVLDAVDRLLQRRGHRVRDHLRVGARVGGVHDDRRRHHFRVLADRQREQRDRAAIVMKAEMTAAKIGRSMKKSEMFMACLWGP